MIGHVDIGHPPGRRRLRNVNRPDGYETWSVDAAQYDLLRALIVRALEAFDTGAGVELGALIAVAEAELTGHPKFSSGRFTNWIRYLKADLEAEGLVERVGRGSPQRIRLVLRG